MIEINNVSLSYVKDLKVIDNIINNSYKYGFISRGLMGTLWQGLNEIVPIDLLNYEAIQMLSKIVTLGFILALFVFYNLCLKKSDEKNMKYMQYLCCFLSVFSCLCFFLK